MDKVKCPTCQKPAYRRGFTKANSQRWRCSCCDRTFTPGRKSPGRPATGQQALATDDPRVRRLINRLTEEGFRFKVRRRAGKSVTSLTVFTDKETNHE